MGGVPLNGKNPAILRAMYIILVPVVAMIILLNSGYLQRLVPAARLNGAAYSVVRYNYYYFDYYNSFLEENALMLDELGYDPSLADSEQSYDGQISWKEFFQRQAEANMAETAYYCDLARAAGYEFSSEELAPVQEKLAENDAQRALNNLSAKNYYISYYGSGMDEALYTAELTRQVKAQAYKAHLAESATPSQEEIDAYLAQTLIPDQGSVDAYIARHPSASYRTVDLRVITLDALPDRVTGRTGPDQWAALGEKLSRLAARYENGVPFEQLQAAFSTCRLGDAAGAVVNATAADLPDLLADWYLNGQDALTVGDFQTFVDSEADTAYFVILDGFGGDGLTQEAVNVLGREAVQAREGEALSDYSVERLRFGMLLATA